MQESLPMNLNSHEIEMLEILEGKRELKFWGAWVTATCEVLKSRGYATGTHRITKKGRRFSCSNGV